MQKNLLKRTIYFQSVFDVLDYLSRWLQGKKKQLNSIGHQPNQSSRSRDSGRELLFDKFSAQIKSVEAVLAAIPPEIISKRAVECKSFSRALFHWEQYIRRCNSQPESTEGSDSELLYQRLQDIYSQIDEPDGIEGISSHLSGLNIDQQVLEHRKAGRWATAQSWYELQLEKEPDNLEAQWNLITCLKESGQQGIYVLTKSLYSPSLAHFFQMPFSLASKLSKMKMPQLRDSFHSQSKHLGSQVDGLSSKAIWNYVLRRELVTSTLALARLSALFKGGMKTMTLCWRRSQKPLRKPLTSLGSMLQSP